MEEKSPTLEVLYEKAEQYAKTSIELFKLKAIGKTAEIVSNMVSSLVVIVCFSICFFIFNIGLSIYVGELLGKLYYGFFIIAGFYALVALIIYLFREQWIKNPISNSIIEDSLK